MTGATPASAAEPGKVLDERSALLFAISQFGKAKKLKEVPLEKRPSQTKVVGKKQEHQHENTHATNMHAAINKVLIGRRGAFDGKSSGMCTIRHDKVSNTPSDEEDDDEWEA